MKKLLFVNVAKPIQDRTTWSGIPFSIYNELRSYYDIDELVVNADKSIFDKAYVAYHRYGKREVCKWLFTERFARRASRNVSEKLNTGNYDAALVIGHSCISFVETNTPILYFSDTVFSNMVDYYWYNLRNQEIKEYNLTQKKALENADVCVFTSEWARNAAIDDYNIDRGKTRVYHFGSNIEIESPKHIDHDGFNLLFVGKDTKRKGIDTAIDCVKICNEMDPKRKYTLHVVGG